MIRINITTEERGDVSKVHTDGEIKGSGDILALEIYAMLCSLEEECPLALMTAITKKVHEHD